MGRWKMAGFYLLLAGEEGLSGDRLDKVDFLVTKLGEEVDPVSGAVIMRDRARLRPIFQGFWAMFDDLSPDVSWLEDRCKEISEFRREIGTVADLDALAESRVVPRYRETKQILGRYLLHPDVLATYAPWLSAIANSFQAGFWEEALFRAVPKLLIALGLLGFFLVPIEGLRWTLFALFTLGALCYAFQRKTA